MPVMTDVYFANLPADSIVPQLYDRVTEFYEQLERNGRLMLWRRAHRYFFALDEMGRHEASAVYQGGEQGELSILKANHYRNLLQHLHVLVTQNRPTFDCRALNTDYASQVQTILGRNILEYYMREQRLDVDYRNAAEVALNYSEAYMELEWDPHLGDEIAPDRDPDTLEPTGKMIKSGDIRARVYEPINTVRPIFSDRDKQDWYILRRFAPRYELMARYPDKADEIRIVSDSMADQRFYYQDYMTVLADKDEDLIPLYVFYHDRTGACPNGRRTVFLSNSVLLDDEALPTSDLPVYPMIPSRQHGTSFGYSVSFDLMCVQEAVDMLYSTILSNQASFGVQNIWMRPGSNLSPVQLAGGLNVIESDQKPEPINLTQTPPEIFKFLQGLEQLSEVLSGVNSVARGQPEASLKSGAALALVASQAVQFSDGLQAAYTRLLEDSGTGLLRMLQKKATLPRAAVIAGKGNKSFAKEFTASDIAGISRVIVDVGNPVSRTIAGRMQMAQDLLQSQVIKHAEQYISVIETGTLEPLIDDQKSEQLLIDAENDALRDGRPVLVIAVDQHLQHIQSHKIVLADPDARQDQDLTARTLAHIQDHINALRTTDPGLLNALGQAPLAPAPGMTPPPPQGANAPQPNAPHPPGPPGPPGPMPPPGPSAGPPPVPPPGHQVPAPQGASPAVAQNMPRMPAPAGQPMPHK